MSRNRSKTVILTAKHFPVYCKDTGEVCPDYQSYLRSEHWRLFKQRYYASKLFRSPQFLGGINGMCVCCQTPNKPLDIHHRSYKRLGAERMQDVIPLCRECHGNVHDKFRELKTNFQGNPSNQYRLMRNASWRKVRRKTLKEHGSFSQTIK